MNKAPPLSLFLEIPVATQKGHKMEDDGTEAAGAVPAIEEKAAVGTEKKEEEEEEEGPSVEEVTREGVAEDTAGYAAKNSTWPDLLGKTVSEAVAFFKVCGGDGMRVAFSDSKKLSDKIS